jgi:hypothetical protein
VKKNSDMLTSSIISVTTLLLVTTLLSEPKPQHDDIATFFNPYPSH